MDRPSLSVALPCQQRLVDEAVEYEKGRLIPVFALYGNLLLDLALAGWRDPKLLPGAISCVREWLVRVVAFPSESCGIT